MVITNQNNKTKVLFQKIKLTKITGYSGKLVYAHSYEKQKFQVNYLLLFGNNSESIKMNFHNKKIAQNQY